MATFNLHKYATGKPKGTLMSRAADGVVLMGALVKQGTNAIDAKETAANSDIVIGVAIYDEATAFTNSADQYADDDPMVVESLVNGMVLNLLNSGTASIAAGARVEAAADGKIAAGSTYPIGIAEETISGSSRGAVIIQVK